MLASTDSELWGKVHFKEAFTLVNDLAQAMSAIFDRVTLEIALGQSSHRRLVGPSQLGNAGHRRWCWVQERRVFVW
jgi:hypothetical protein